MGPYENFNNYPLFRSKSGEDFFKVILGGGYYLSPIGCIIYHGLVPDDNVHMVTSKCHKME